MNPVKSTFSEAGSPEIVPVIQILLMHKANENPVTNT